MQINKDLEEIFRIFGYSDFEIELIKIRFKEELKIFEKLELEKLEKESIKPYSDKNFNFEKLEDFENE